jgi:hypothetical protein
MTDIDLDFLDRSDILSKIKHVPAFTKDGKKHNTGVYCQKIPKNPLTGTASFDYEIAEERGYFKIDFLNVSAYKGVRDEEHLNHLLNQEPVWELMYEKDVCDKLFHVNGHHKLLAELKPKTILELAMVLALIRPGKKHLLPICKEKGFSAIENDIWVKTSDSYYFKKGHALGYSSLIIVQLNLICQQLNGETS